MTATAAPALELGTSDGFYLTEEEREHFSTMSDVDLQMGVVSRIIEYALRHDLPAVKVAELITESAKASLAL